MINTVKFLEDLCVVEILIFVAVGSGRVAIFKRCVELTSSEGACFDKSIMGACA